MKRWQLPVKSVESLLMLLSAVVASIGVVSAVIGVLALVRIADQIDRLDHLSDRTRVLTEENDRRINEIQESRRQGLAFTCATLSAVIDSGRLTILAGPRSISPELEAGLRPLGFPPLAERIAAAEVGAKIYAQRISEAVEKATNQRGLVRKDGSLNCMRLQRVVVR